MQKKLNKKNIFIIFIILILILFYFYYSNSNKKKIIKNNNKIETSKTKLKNNSKTKEKIQNFYKKFDLDSDDSITKFVSKDIPLNNKKYIPKNLVEVNHIFIYTNKQENIILRKVAKDALVKLSIEFSKKFNSNLKVVSWYRSYKTQKKIEESACSKNLCAKAWFSEHQTWLAVDLWQASDKEEFFKNDLYKEYFDWMNKNAYKFWFINTYKKWLKIDSYEIEPWHWRYVWKELAYFLYKNNLSFAEFYKKSKQK